MTKTTKASHTSSSLLRLRHAFEKMNVYPHAQSLANDEDLFAKGALDSLVMIQFVLAIEDEFSIRLENADIAYENFASFQKLAHLLQSRYSIPL
ncbi:MAG: phosphopantetheine-binding protein [Bdellovibrionaceae bacterium]|nr:phosphopantetheine-binding protein [Pseudobdellovibrionaceae bacterium]